MSSIFPIRDTVTPDGDREPRLVDLDEENADEVFQALASETTREIFLELHQSPQTTSDLAEATGTSVQNVQYHLSKLRDSDLVEVVDTWYSERGTEMKVYAPEDESLVLFAGRDKQRSLRSLLDRFVGIFGLLIPGSLLAGLGASRFVSDSGGGGGAGPDLSEQVIDSSSTGGGGEAPNAGSDAGTMTIDGSEGAESPPTVDGSVDSVDVAYNVTSQGDLARNESVDLVLGNETVATNVSPEYYRGQGVETASTSPAYDLQEVILSYSGNNTATGDGPNSLASPDLANGTAAVEGVETVTLPAEALNQSVEATDAAAAIDPALGAAVAFFIGGCVGASALLAWSGYR